MGFLFPRRRALSAKFALALTLSGVLCGAACGQVVTYYPGSGVLTLNNSGSNYNSTLESLDVYLASYQYLPTSGSLSQLSDWSWGIVSTQTQGLTGGNYLDWGSQSFSSSDALPQGVDTLAQLPTGLSALSFGYSYHKTAPPINYVDGPDDTSGAVVFTTTSDSTIDAFVNMKRSVPSENDWTGSVNASWNNAGNWSLSHAASSTETASFVTSSLAGTVTLDHNQSAGSLWFDSTSPYTIVSGSGAYALSLSNTANIWIDSGLHTISAPLALSGSTTIDAEPVDVSPGSVGLTVSGQVSGASSLTKMGPGILYLSNTNNTYSGNTFITGGTLSAAAAGSLGASGSVSISNATLDFSGGGGALSRAVVLTGAISNTIQVDSGTITLSGVIGGSGGLTKAGNATLALANAGNAFGGGANVTAGTLQIRSATALPSASTVTVAGGAALDLYGTSPSLATISGAGTVTNNYPSTTSTLTAAYVGGAASYSAAIQDGTGKIALSVPSGGMLILSNTANAFSEGSSVSGGTLGISADGSLGAPASGVAINNGMLQLQGSTNFALGSGRGISLAGNSSIDVVPSQSATIAGVVSGGTLTKTNAGTLYLAGSNTYSGGTVVNGGILAASSDANLGAAGTSVTINNGTLQLSGGTSTHPLVVGSGYPALAASSGTLTVAGPISGASALALTGPGAVVLTNQNNSFGGVNLEGGTLVNNDPTGATLGGSEIMVTGGTLTGNGAFTQAVELNAGGNLMAGSANTMGTMTFLNNLAFVQGASSPTWTLKINANGNSDCLDFGQQANSPTGTPSTMTLTGTSALVVSGALLPSTTVPYNIITDLPSAVNLRDLVVQPPLGFTASLSQPVSYNNPYSFPNGYYTVTLSFTSASAWSVSSGGNWNTNSNWSNYVPLENNDPRGGCTAMFGAAGSGTVVLPGSGATTYVNTLVFANSNNSYTLTAGPGGSTIEYLSNGTAPSGGIVSEGAAFVEVVSGSHTIAANAQLAGPLDVSMPGLGTQMTFSGAVSGSGGLALSGSGSLILSGSNTYTGLTSVSGGTLSARGASSLSPNAAVTLNGGVLDVASSPQTINALAISGGTLNLYGGNILTLSGTAGFAGTLNVLGTVTGGTDDLMNYTSYSGSFSATSLPANYTLDYLPTELALVVPSAGPVVVTPSSNSTWSAAPWQGGRPPNGAGKSAAISVSGSNSPVITLDVPATLGSLQLGSTANAGVTLAGTTTLTLDNGGSSASLGLSQGTAEVAVHIVLNSNLSVSSSAGSTLTINGNIGQSTTASLTLSGGGELILSGSNSYTGGTLVEGGTLDVIAAGGLPNGSPLDVGGGGTLVLDSVASGSLIEPAETAAPVSVASSVSPVPEPGTLALLAALALCSSAAWLRKRMRQASLPLPAPAGLAAAGRRGRR